MLVIRKVVRHVTKNAIIGLILFGAGWLLIQGYVHRVLDFSGSMPERCQGKQWKNPGEQLDCKYPPPPIGRWHAVYTEEFAVGHNLPPENVSTDLPLSIDYMEMDVQPYGAGGTACLVNMLIKKPHDVALYGEQRYSWAMELHKQRKLAHSIDIERNKSDLKEITTFGLAPLNFKYHHKKAMGRGGAFAFYLENVLEGYDYITANANCGWISRNSNLYPDRYAFWVAKASIWGRYETPYRHLHAQGRPKKQDFYDSHFFINIPHELVTNIFKDIPLGGQ